MSDREANPLAAPPGPGETLGAYVLDEQLGMGGMATVYRAHDAEGRVVAIKIMHPAALLPEDRLRFDREFETQRRLDHPNVVKVIEAGSTDSFPWIAMEFVDGDDLGAVSESWPVPRKRADFARIDGIIRAVCSGLAHIHARGLIHRDLKPQNVLMSQDGRPKLSDFGVVKDPDAPGTALTRAGRLVGTVAFMAPEQITNDQVDLRADMYSLGALMYLLLTGQRPIEARSVAGYLARHLTEMPKPPTAVNPEIPAHLSRVCMRLLAKDAAERYPSATAVVEALDRADDDESMPIRGRDPILAELARLVRLVHTESVAACACLVGPPGSGRTILLAAAHDMARQAGVSVRALDPDSELNTDWDGEPMLLTIDNAERMQAAHIDALDRAVLGKATREGLPLLVLSASSTRRGVTDRLGGASGLVPDVIALQPLDRNDVIGMMRDHDLAGPAAPVLGRRLHGAFAGMPGPIVQQVDALVQTGWLTRVGTKLKAARPMEAFRNGELPVPASVSRRLTAALDRLSEQAVRAAEILATFDRPVGADLLTDAIGPAGPGALSALYECGLAVRGEIGDVERIRFAHPSCGAVTRARMDTAQMRAIAAIAAGALSRRRRRADAFELASLYDKAGDPAHAYPAYVRAARRAAREARFPDVLKIAATAGQIQTQAEVSLTPEETLRYRRWLYLLAGEAHLARAQWTEAVRPLDNAAAAARLEADRPAIARALTSLGRAHYRQGAFAAAKPVLEEALTFFDAGDPLRASASRALADIRLQEGDFTGAEALWQDSLVAARAAQSVDGEARAMRGQAHVRALQGRLDDSAGLLEAALDRLDRGGDHRVRAGVLARALELDLAAARLGSAAHRSERLVEHVQQQELSDRIADAWVLRALVLQEIGQTETAADAARTALTYAGVQGVGAWNTRLRAARVLLTAGFFDQASDALPDPDKLPASRVEDPSAQVAGVRARLLAGTDKMAARDLAMWALTRPEPVLVLRAYRIKIDASRALSAIGAIDAAREAAKQALRLVDRPGTEGFRLGALLALYAASPDSRVAQACMRLADRIAARLNPSVSASFRSRPDLAALPTG